MKKRKCGQQEKTSRQRVKGISLTVKVHLTLETALNYTKKGEQKIILPYF